VVAISPKVRDRFAQVINLIDLSGSVQEVGLFFNHPLSVAYHQLIFSNYLEKIHYSLPMIKMTNLQIKITHGNLNSKYLPAPKNRQIT